MNQTEHARTVERGRAAYARKAWEEAYQALSRADRSAPLAAGDLEPLAWSAALTGRDAELLVFLERLYQGALAGGECVAAARYAFWLGFRLFALGESGRAGGWRVSRAEG